MKAISFDELMRDPQGVTREIVQKSLEVTQDQLRSILELEARRDALIEEIVALRSNVEFRIRNFGHVSSGLLTAFIEKHAGRRCPKWREEFEKVCGREIAEAIIEATPVGEGYEKLVIKSIIGNK